MYVSKYPLLTKNTNHNCNHNTHTNKSKREKVNDKNGHHCNNILLNNKRTSPFTSKNFLNIKDKLTERQKTKGMKENKITKPFSHSNEDNSGLKQCIVCFWNFPPDMSNKDKNIHINKCLEGEGENHIKNYKEKQAINRLNSSPLEDVDYDKCPICQKIFKIKNIKIKMNHVYDCLKAFQEEDFYANNKKRGKI